MWEWHLQWFAGEKTEKPTEKKRREARKKGQVARSQEVNTALLIIFCFLALSILGPQTFDGMERIMSHVLGLTTQENLSPVVVLKTGGDVALRSFFLMAPYLLVALAAGLLANFLQVGFLFSSEALKVNWGRLNPLSGIKRIFGKHALAELAKCLFKVSVIGYAAYSIVAKNFVVFPKLMEMNIQTAVATIGQIGFDVGWRVGLLLIFVAAFDFWFQRYTHEESLKMSKQEVKDERKQMEGDPEVKARIRQKMRQMAMRRMMQELPKADVVITNPTHYAVALKYETGKMAAPVVIAKGQDFVAWRIKEIAADYDIPTVEDKPLAQALYHSVEIGQEIPAELFQAVAEILAFIYRLKRKKISI